MAIGNLLGCGSVRPRLGHEHRLAVVPQLLDGFLYVGECAVVPGLARGLIENAGIPAADQLLYARYINAAIVHVPFEGWHVARQEGSIGPDGVSGERGLAGLSDVASD